MSNSAPSASNSSPAWRRSDVLCESRRRLPLMPRTRIELGLLRQLQVDDDRDVVRQGRLAARERVVPADAELRAVDLRLGLEAEARAAVRVVDRVGDDAGDLDGLGVALDRDLAVDRDLVAVTLDRLRLERQLRIALGVEEVRALKVRLEVRVLDLNARDLRRSLEHAVGDGRIEVGEGAGKGAGHVVDSERDVGVDLVDGPGAGRYCLGLSGAHVRDAS